VLTTCTRQRETNSNDDLRWDHAPAAVLAADTTIVLGTKQQLSYYTPLEYKPVGGGKNEAEGNVDGDSLRFFFFPKATVCFSPSLRCAAFGSWISWVITKGTKGKGRKAGYFWLSGADSLLLLLSRTAFFFFFFI